MKFWYSIPLGLVAGALLLRGLAALAFSPLWPPPVAGAPPGPGNIATYTAFYSADIGVNALSTTNSTKALQVYLGRPDNAFTVATPGPACDIYIGANLLLDFNRVSCPDYAGNPNQLSLNEFASMRAGIQADAVGTGSAGGGLLTISSVTSGTFTPGQYVDNQTIWIVAAVGTGCDPAHPTVCGAQYTLSTSFSTPLGTRTGHAPWLRVHGFYDQTVSNACGGSCDVFDEGGDKRHRYRFGFGADGVCSLSGHSCMWGDGSTVGSGVALVTAGNIAPVAPIGFSAVGMTSTASGWIKAGGNATNSSNALESNGSVVFVVSGTLCASGSPPGGSIHSAQGAQEASVNSSTLTFDGTLATASSSTCNVDSTASLLTIIHTAVPMNGEFYYTGVGNGQDFTTAIQCQLALFDNRYFGTPKGSC